MRASRRILFLLIVLALLLLFLAVPGVSWADIWGDGARQLAGKISASVSPGQRVALTLRNFSSLGAAEVAQVRSALEAELRGQDVRLVEALPSDVDLRVTLSEFAAVVWCASRPRYGGTLRVEMRAEVASLDPADWPTDPAQAAAKEKLGALVFDRLVRLDENGQPQPALAVSWQHDAENKQWQFRRPCTGCCCKGKANSLGAFCRSGSAGMLSCFPPPRTLGAPGNFGQSFHRRHRRSCWSMIQGIRSAGRWRSASP